jgi:hypothetical protein
MSEAASVKINGWFMAYFALGLICRGDALLFVSEIRIAADDLILPRKRH